MDFPIKLRKKDRPLTLRTSDDIVEELVSFGRPHMHCHEDLTWSASVDLNTDKVKVGLEAKLRSGFRCPTLKAALIDVLEKCRGL